MFVVCSDSPSATALIAAQVAELARIGDIIVLAGEMGSGKTAFAQGFGRALGITEPITSPTFTLVHSYQVGKITLLHADLYRLDRTTEVADLAFAELAEFGGIVLIEWGDVVNSAFGEHLEVHVEFGDDDDDQARRITFSAVGETWRARLERLRVALAGFSC
jgi:tRNA threonylcarbamoyladenosine biosynthesis protein TsaE